MTKMTHTPGPWRCGGVNKNIVYGSENMGDENRADMREMVVAHCNHTGEVSPSIDVANARLIAAAPDMLAALKDAADTIKDWDGGDQSEETGWKHDDLLDAWMAIRAVIAKAEGT